MTSYSAAAPRPSKLLLAALLFAGAAFVAGIGIGVVTGHDKAATKTIVKTQANSKTGASSYQTTETSEGAVGTATQFLTSFPTISSVGHETQLSNAVTSLNYPFSESTFSKDVTDSVSSTKGTVTTSAFFRIVPLGYKVDVTTASTQITILSTALLVDPGTGKSSSIWTTSIFSMHFYNGQWRVAKWQISAGPSLAPSGDPSTQTAYQLKPQLDQYRSYDNVTT